ncbi:hypothetical protein EIP91_009881 [Steccherinum ochraceum]|uniref:ribonuclease Z n=1 Tax=Steccherinum ochraceum TaxID=92696 RepID=A0A4R0RR69_9APHY|nr:hypothetical protein EIP91_009881 [Steccherinum ochraceum]
MLWSASTISAVSSDTEPTVVVQFDAGKYIFNAGENTGRAWLQGRSKWAKAKGIFLTQNGTQRGSGLAGLTMFLADAGVKSLDVVGPEGVSHFLASMRTYLWRGGINVKVAEAQATLTETEKAKPTPIFKDSKVNIYAIPLFASSSETSAQNSGVNVGEKRKRDASPDSTTKRPHTERGGTDGSNLTSRIASPDFTPLALTGEHAVEWRKLTVENMFPATTAPPPPTTDPSTKQKKKGKNKAADPDTKAVAATPTPAPAPEEPQKHLGRKDVLAHRDRLLPPFQSSVSRPSLGYVVVGPAVRGKFDVAKANELGVPKGPIRGKLTAGQDVTFEVDDGNGGKVQKTVHPHQVVGPSDPPHVVMILDVPSVDHIPSLVSAFNDSPFYSSLRSQNETHQKEHVVHAVFHILGNDVLENKTYRSFMDGFSTTTHHIVSSRQHAPDPATFTSAAVNQLSLGQLDSQMFPPHHYRLESLNVVSGASSLPSNVHPFRTGLVVDVRPARAPALDEAIAKYDRFHPVAAGDTALVIPEDVKKAFEEAQAVATGLPVKLLDSPSATENALVIPLGTSSALPSKYRNVSSTFIQRQEGNILLDCGEGTWGQLCRAFGRDDTSGGVWEVLRNLKCIYISHIHGDHHIGLAKVLAMRKQLSPPPQHPLYLVGTRPVHLYIREQSDIEDLGVDDPSGNGVVSILSDSLNFRGPETQRYSRVQQRDREEWMGHSRSVALKRQLCAALGLKNFTTVDVDHRTRCYGLVLDYPDGGRIVFSGDTQPTPNLVKAGQNATLLIHEATMGDDQEELAAQKAHSTIGQALAIGKEMNARNIMLTHFSARYPKMPPAVLQMNDADPNTTIVLAFDHAQVRIADMPKLKAYLPALEKFFGDVASVEEDAEEAAVIEVDTGVPHAG